MPVSDSEIIAVITFFCKGKKTLFLVFFVINITVLIPFIQ